MASGQDMNEEEVMLSRTHGNCYCDPLTLSKLLHRVIKFPSVPVFEKRGFERPKDSIEIAVPWSAQAIQPFVCSYSF